MKTIIKYSKSVNSSNLQDDDLNHKTDILAAVALSSQLGSALFRAKYAGTSNIHDLYVVWHELTLRRAKKLGFEDKHTKVAELSLFYWMNDICDTCHGREHPKIPNAPILENIVCPICDGSGKRIIQCDQEILDHVKDSIEILNSLCNESAHKAKNKLGY